MGSSRGGRGPSGGIEVAAPEMENHIETSDGLDSSHDAGRLDIDGDSFAYPQGLARLLVLDVGRGMGHLGARASTGRHKG